MGIGGIVTKAPGAYVQPRLQAKKLITAVGAVALMQILLTRDAVIK